MLNTVVTRITTGSLARFSQKTQLRSLVAIDACERSAFWKLSLALVLVPILTLSCQKQSPPPPPGPSSVSYVVIEPQRVELTTRLPGRTSAYRVAEIRPQVSGLILKRLFTEGSQVTAGQVLYEIDPAPFAAALATAEGSLARIQAQLPAAKSRAGRFQKLSAAKAASRQDYEDALAVLTQIEAEIKAGQASVEAARIQLNYTKITAPISGQIGASSVTDGAIVTAYQPTSLATIQQLTPIYVDVPQSTADLIRLKNRMKDGRLSEPQSNHSRVQLFLEDGSLFPLEGILQFSDVTVDPTTGSITLRALFDNPEALLLPGMFVQALIKEAINEQALLIPQSGVSRDPKGNPYALLVDSENKVLKRDLTVDRPLGSNWLVSSGITPGDRVIVEGLLMLRPGMAVNPLPFMETRKNPN